MQVSRSLFQEQLTKALRTEQFTALLLDPYAKPPTATETSLSAEVTSDSVEGEYTKVMAPPEQMLEVLRLSPSKSLDSVTLPMTFNGARLVVCAEEFDYNIPATCGIAFAIDDIRAPLVRHGRCLVVKMRHVEHAGHVLAYNCSMMREEIEYVQNSIITFLSTRQVLPLQAAAPAPRSGLRTIGGITCRYIALNPPMDEFPKCANCGEDDKTGSMRKCGQCRAVKYCSKQCQKAHWKHHKPTCKPE